MKIKKLLLPILSSFLLLSTLGCNNNKNLEANIIKDQYRTYYEIFVGAYSDSDKNGLGDFKGLYNRLDYLNDGKPNKESAASPSVRSKAPGASITLASNSGPPPIIGNFSLSV